MPRDVPVADVPASLGNIQLNVLQINPCMFLYRKVRIKTKQRILLSPAAGYCCSPSTSGLKHHHAFHFEFEFYLTVLLKHIFYKIPSLYMLFTVLQDEHCLRKNERFVKETETVLPDLPAAPICHRKYGGMAESSSRQLPLHNTTVYV